MRYKDKLIKLEGKSVVLEEIEPKYFPNVIKWRNDEKLNKFLNHNSVFTLESEKEWYLKKYMTDLSQAYLIIIDKKSGIPIGTQGWTDFDKDKRQCIEGNLLLGDKRYANSFVFMESFLVMDDYIYQFVDVMYTHISNENESSLKLNDILGFEAHNAWEYPNKQVANGIEQQEFYRTKEMYLKAKDFLMNRLEIWKWPIMK